MESEKRCSSHSLLLIAGNAILHDVICALPKYIGLAWGLNPRLSKRHCVNSIELLNPSVLELGTGITHPKVGLW
jgi:hypothetical protein